jgi:hypothetical protein
MDTANSALSRIKIATILLGRGVDGVIPFTMKLVPFQVYLLDFFIGDFPAGRVFPTVQTAGYPETFGGRRTRDQIDDCLIIAKRLAAETRNCSGLA